MNRLIVAGIAITSVVSADYTDDALADQIHDLPDAPADLDYNMFSGYLNVDETNDVNYFYWFAECDGCDKDTAPVALWTNGGPGCSGNALHIYTFPLVSFQILFYIFLLSPHHLLTSII